MDINQLVQTLNSSPSVKLLKMRNAEFFLAFVTSVFDEQMAIREEKLHMLLENRLDNQRDSITVDDIGTETLGELFNVCTSWLISIVYLFGFSLFMYAKIVVFSWICK